MVMETSGADAGATAVKVEAVELRQRRNCDESTNLKVRLTGKASISEKDVVAVLASLFTRLAQQMQLCVKSSDLEGRTICCRAGSRTRQVLFGSALLEVTQTIRFCGNGVFEVRLHWYHPSPERSRWTLQGGKRGYEKRARFIVMFNTAWSRALNLNPSVQAIDGMSELKTIGKENQWDAMRAIETMSGFGHIDISGNSSSFSDTSSSQSDLENTMKPSCKSGRDLEVSDFQAPPLKKQRSSLRLGPKSKSAVDFTVRFSPSKPRVMELPLSKEDREARMADGNTATFSCGTLKPLRSSKTGEYIWNTYNINHTFAFGNGQGSSPTFSTGI